MATSTITIDFDQAFEIAVKGVRRASVFMGLGVNAAVDKHFKSYQLSHITNIQIVPDNLPDDTLDHIKNEFRIWIEASGLRELSESFSIFLDALHRECLIVQTVLSRSSLAEIEEKQISFAKEGLPNKLNTLRQRFMVEPKNSNHILTIGRTRNCLAHRNGIVGIEDLHDKQTLSVKWFGLDLFLETPDGQVNYFEAIPLEGLYLPEGGVIKAQFMERRRDFNHGEHVVFSTRDLAEICWFYLQEAQATLSTAIDYAKKSGVKVASEKT